MSDDINTNIDALAKESDCRRTRINMYVFWGILAPLIFMCVTSEFAIDLLGIDGMDPFSLPNRGKQALTLTLMMFGAGYLANRFL